MDVDLLSVDLLGTHLLQVDSLGFGRRDWWNGNGGGGAGSVVLEDNFDEVSTTFLGDHSPDIGGPWTRSVDSDWSSAGSARLQISAGVGEVSLVAGSTNAACSLPESGSADLDITATFVSVNTGVGEALIFFRSLLAERTGYSFGLRDGDKLTLDHWTTGTPTNLYQSGDLTLSVDIVARLRIVGTSIKVWLTDILDVDTPVYDDTDGTHSGPDYIHAYCSGFGGVNIRYLEVSEL